mmetsp:Transcript_39464/g.114237  ORF Transcript_39464/g.114237 Transcript_39464/m.114237 type:complete len:216 (-) Transcript_39464:300-947(-)
MSVRRHSGSCMRFGQRRARDWQRLRGAYPDSACCSRILWRHCWHSYAPRTTMLPGSRFCSAASPPTSASPYAPCLMGAVRSTTMAQKQRPRGASSPMSPSSTASGHCIVCPASRRWRLRPRLLCRNWDSVTAPPTSTARRKRCSRVAVASSWRGCENGRGWKFGRHCASCPGWAPRLLIASRSSRSASTLVCLSTCTSGASPSGTTSLLSEMQNR